MEPTQSETNNVATDLQAPRESWYRKFINGDLGLAWTFWYHGMLPVFLLKFVVLFSYTLAHSGTLALVVAAIALAYLCLVLTALLRAAPKYEGSQVWPILAVLVVILFIVNWASAIFGFFSHAAT